MRTGKIKFKARGRIVRYPAGKVEIGGSRWVEDMIRCDLDLSEDKPLKVRTIAPMQKERANGKAQLCSVKGEKNSRVLMRFDKDNPAI